MLAKCPLFRNVRVQKVEFCDFFRSMKTPQEKSPLFRFFLISSTILNMACSVEYFFLNPNCKLCRIRRGKVRFFFCKLDKLMQALIYQEKCPLLRFSQFVSELLLQICWNAVGTSCLRYSHIRNIYFDFIHCTQIEYNIKCISISEIM